jgi:hypothetical protein
MALTFILKYVGTLHKVIALFHFQYHICFLHFDFLRLEKQFINICSIVIGEVTYHLVACTLAIQFKGIIAQHFIPH